MEQKCRDGLGCDFGSANIKGSALWTEPSAFPLSCPTPEPPGLMFCLFHLQVHLDSPCPWVGYWCFLLYGGRVVFWQK